LCKAAEVEIVERLIKPLRQACRGVDLDGDVKDQDLGRVARYCAGRAEKAPELGAIAHLLETAVNSKRRIRTSPLLKALDKLLRGWPRPNWWVDANGAASALRVLATKFRNPAAHTDELSKADYEGCFEAVVGPGGLLWRVVESSGFKSR
jgi:hypothetical protein